MLGGHLGDQSASLGLTSLHKERAPRFPPAEHTQNSSRGKELGDTGIPILLFLGPSDKSTEPPALPTPHCVLGESAAGRQAIFPPSGQREGALDCNLRRGQGSASKVLIV